MKKTTIFIAIFLAASMFLSVAEANCNVTEGVWTNELGSTMTLVVDSSGAISGSYKTAVSCISEPLPKTPLAGFCSGNDIYFTVTWDINTQCPSTTVWQGTLQTNGTLEMPWTLYAASSTDTGADKFAK